MVASIEKKIYIQTKIYNKQNESGNIEIRNKQKPCPFLKSDKSSTG